MLVPGEDRGLGVETFGVSRKFSTGKVSKKKNAELTAERQAIEKALEGSVEAMKTKAVLEEYKERRGASLMERHAADRAEAAAIKAGRSVAGAWSLYISSFVFVTTTCTLYYNHL
jgi:erythromycin esterase-like protein